jgi:hypothetical protein
MAHLHWSVQPVHILIETFLKAGTKLWTIKSIFSHFRRLIQNYLRDFRWLYTYFLAVDANFRLKLKNRGINDPEIGSGWSYFVESKQYNKHISQATLNEPEVNLPKKTCLSNSAHVCLGRRMWFRLPRR